MVNDRERFMGFDNLGSYHLHAWMHHSDDNQYGYIAGYRKAGDLLVDAVLEGRESVDFLVYPIMFCYRQHLELTLKRLIKDSCNLLDESIEQYKKCLDNHDLTPLWLNCSFLLERTEELPADFKVRVKGAVDFYESYDKKSFSFRYWNDKNGNRSLPHELKTLHVGKLVKSFSDVFDNLIAAQDQISYLLDLKSDLDREMRDWYGC